MNSRKAEWSQQLAQLFARGFDAVPPPFRTIGREAEFPVVDNEGKAGNVQLLLQTVAQVPSLSRNTKLSYWSIERAAFYLGR